MPVSIKIECECGQHYAFEVEPVDGRMPAPALCPSCGADGTTAANAILARPVQAQMVAIKPAAGPLRVALPASAKSGEGTAASRAAERRGGTLLPGQLPRVQAQHEARAKMLWGDSPAQVQVFLMSQGFSREDAAELVEDLRRERVSIIRMKGIKYISLGVVLLGIPILIFLLNGRLPRARALGLLGVMAVFGAGLAIKGISLVLAPKSESGDAAEEVDVDSLFD